ncbi:MAG: hypothetical protein JWN78_3249, partial [Bacteroidota bacterium]|nr:hypothetical protein [Bacteroidota bacterium]
ILSNNNQQSCSSCHKQQYSFSDGKKLAIGTYGDTLERNTPSLINLAWSKHFFWDGRVKKLEDVMLVPLFNKKEMGATEADLLKKLNSHPYYPVLFEQAFGTREITVTNICKALSQFLRTIVSTGVHLPDDVLNIAPEGETDSSFYYKKYKEESVRGTYFRFSSMCGGCHISEIYSSENNMATNGVNVRVQLMKIPSLMNIMMTAPYMHDGRFKTIEEVMEHYDKHLATLIDSNPQLIMSLKYRVNKIENLLIPYDKKNEYKLFELFKDSNLIVNKRFSSPFAEPGFTWDQSIKKN